MSFTGALVTSLRRAATFSGRASRWEFWCFMAFYVWLWLLILVLLFSIPVLAPVFMLAGLSAVLPMLSVTVRRLHDLGRSAWWLLLSLVPLVGSYALSVMLVLPGSPAENHYGPAPTAEPAMA